MIFRIARHEFIGTLRDGRFRWAAAILGVLLAAALFAGWSYQRDLTAQRQSAEEAEKGRWIRQPNANPHAAGHYGIFAFKPRLAPAFLDPGVEPYAGVAVMLASHEQSDALHRPGEDATAVQRFGDLTAALVLQLLLPLLIVIMTFASVAGERERGLLRQVLVVGLDPVRWLTAKALGLTAALALLLVPAVAASAMALAWAGNGAVIEGGWVRFTFMAACYLVYLLAFLLAAIGVSAITRTARAALISLLGIWMLNGLLMPRLVSELAARRYPAPTSLEFRHEHERRSAANPHERTAETERIEQAMMRRHNVSRPEDLPINRAGLGFLVAEATNDRMNDEVFGRLFDQLEAQNSFRRAFSWIAPSVGMQSLSLALAGTDYTHHRGFLDAAESHRRLMQRRLNTFLMINGTRDGSVYRADRSLWATIPLFEYHAPAPLDVLRDQAVPLLTLVAWFSAAGVFLFIAGRRLNPLH